jgi:hypothetical protein
VLAAKQHLQLLGQVMVPAVLHLRKHQQQLRQQVVRAGRGLLLQLALAPRCVTLVVAVLGLLGLRSMHGSLTATTAWTCHSRQTGR